MSHVGMLLFRLGFSRAQLWLGWAGRSFPPLFHGEAKLEPLPGWCCFAGRGDTPHDIMMPLRFGAFPTNLVWKLSWPLTWPRGLYYFNPGLIMQLIPIADS